MKIETYNRLEHLQYYVGCFYHVDDRKIHVIGVFGGDQYCFFLCEWDDTKQLFCIEPYEVICLVDHPYI